jgi:hypothetical protein
MNIEQSGNSKPLYRVGPGEALQQDPGDFRFADGSPLYNVLLAPNAAGVMRPEDAQDARDRLHALHDTFPSAVEACMTLSPEIARKLLTELESRMQPEMRDAA